MKTLKKILSTIGCIIEVGIWVLIVGIVLSTCGYCIYDSTLDPIYDCGIVKEVGGCGRFMGCRVRLEDGRAVTVPRLVVPGEKACWQVGKK